MVRLFLSIGYVERIFLSSKFEKGLFFDDRIIVCGYCLSFFSRC